MKRVWWVLIILLIFTVVFLCWPKKSYMESNVICYESQTVNGLGDRLLDICYIMTKSPDSKIRVKWNLGKDQERSTYDTNLIQIDNGEITTTQLESCTLDLQLEKPWYPGANTPPLEQVDLFRDVAKRIKPSPEVENVIPSGEKYVTIHIRGKDKIVGDEYEDGILTTRKQFKQFKDKCVEYVKSHPEKMYFVCSDDEELKLEFIKDCGSDIKLLNSLNYGNLDRAIVDLFVMSRSELIIQCTKYSTFSIVASIIGGVPLLNFHKSEMMGNVADWKPFLYPLNSENIVVVRAVDLNDPRIPKNTYVILDKTNVLDSLDSERVIVHNESSCKAANPLHNSIKHSLDSVLWHVYERFNDVDFKYLWLLEDDVYVDGSLDGVLKKNSSRTEDFLASFVEDYEAGSGWVWWDELVSRDAGVSVPSLEERVKSFFPVTRYSKEFLKEIHDRIGVYSGYCEVYIPTLAKQLGYTYGNLEESSVGNLSLVPIHPLPKNGDDRLYHKWALNM